MSVRRWPLLAIAILALALLLGRAAAGVYADYRWYESLGATALWRERTLLTAALRIGSALAASAFVFANLYAVRHSVVSLVLPRRVANLEIGEEVPGRYLVGAALLISAVLGWMLALPSDSWRLFALVRHGVPFNETDPYFNADLGFFVYWLPLEITLYVTSLIAVLLVAAVVIFLYALTPSLRWERGTLYVSNYVRRHLVVLGCALLLVLAWSYRLDIYKSVLEGSAAGGAFGFVDHQAVIPVCIWLSILSVAAAFAVLFFGWAGQVRLALGSVAAILFLSLVLRQVAPALVRHYSVSGESDSRDRPYLATRAEYTRRAYAIDRMASPDPLYLFSNVREAAALLPAWDPVALRRAIGRSGRTDSAERPVAYAASPSGLVAIDAEPLAGSDSGSANAWRLTRVLAGGADRGGAPARATPPAADRDGESVIDVRVFPGAEGYELVTDTASGVAAPALGEGVSRLALAWSLQNLRLVAGEPAPAGARLLTRRAVRDRVDALAPFFAQSALFAIVVDDSLYWGIDLYSVSQYYPLSERDSLGDDVYSYAQHAAVALVNAHTGRTLLVADSVRDPLAASWIDAYPTVFLPLRALPPAIAHALPPARDAARLQATVLARYGRRGESARDGRVPASLGADGVIGSDDPPPYALPGDRSLGWGVPVLDQNEHVAGLVLATSGAGQRASRWLALPDPGARWSTIVDQLRRALDSTAGSPHDARLVHGPVRAVATGSGLAFTQSAYAWTGDGASLLRVGILTEHGLTTGRTMTDALGVRVPGDSAALPPQELRARVELLYEQMRSALQRGDWVAFGRAYEALGALLGVPKR
ncbi:MAG TPA: UPF0182 family protein [Gemmatimonadaceae bacterium]|nr:UPF0182 family protein [Gemmatimonadaceae bacterium]